MAVLLLPGGSVTEARRQLSAQYGHVAIGRTAHLDLFLNLYQEWLERQEAEHSPAAFRRWATQEYCPGECRCELELLRAPTDVAVAEPFALVVRARNTSVRAWRFCRGNDAGIHAVFQLFDAEMQPLGRWRAGRFDADP